MIVRSLRWTSGLDRSYFLALSAFLAAIVASVFLAFAQTVELEDGTNLTLIEDVGAAILVLIVLPVLVLAAPLVALPQKTGPVRKNDKVNSFASTGVLLAFTVAFLLSLGIFYVPALMLSIASTTSLFFGRKKRAGGGANGAPDTDGEGVRMSRSARKRARQEAASQVPEDKGASPLHSSRRRRGRKRRSR